MNKGQLSENPYAWNDRAHLLFVDQPRHVGMSTVNNPSRRCQSRIEAAADIVMFFNNWKKEFPELFTIDRKVYIAGESKAGQYVPAWGKAIMDHNKENPETKINLAGILLGNACTDYAKQVYDANWFIDYAKAEKLLPSNYGSSSR